MNIRSIFLYLCFSFPFLAAFAQKRSDQEIYNQYLREIKNLKEDTNKVNVYFKYAKLLRQPDTALSVIATGMKLTRLLNYAGGDRYLQPLRAQKELLKYRTETRYKKDDTLKVLECLKMTMPIEPYFPDSALLIAKTAKEISDKLDYARGAELSWFYIGNHFEMAKKIPLAIYYYRQAVAIALLHKAYIGIDTKNTPEIYELFNACLNIYYYQADYPNALDIAQKGLLVTEQLSDKSYEAHFDNQVGFIYQKQDKASESIRYYGQYLKLANDLNNRMMVADACEGMADGYLSKKNYQISLTYLFKALNIYSKMKEQANGIDSEKFEINRAATKHVRLARTLYKISRVYAYSGDYGRALYYSVAIFDIYDKRYRKSGGVVFDAFDLADYYTNAGYLYGILKDYKQADGYLRKGLALARAIGHREDTRDAYEALSRNFAAQKRYDSAYVYHILFTGLKDSIINEKVSRQISTLEVARRDKEIALLNQQQKLKENEAAQLNTKRNFIIGFAALAGLIAIGLIVAQSRIKQQKLVFEKQLAVQTERQRISGDMHDDIGTGLSTMLLYVNMLKSKLSDQLEYADIDRVSSLGNELVVQMREIVWSLNPGNDSLESLLVFIRQYFAQLFEPLPYHTSIDMPAKMAVHPIKGSTRRNVFLCVKEALNNIIKHAKADEVELHVETGEDKLVIRIKDNGTGFPDGSGSKSFSNGLKNMRRRMDLVNGKFQYFNEGGAVIRIELGLEG